MVSKLYADKILSQAVAHTELLLASGELEPEVAMRGLTDIVNGLCRQCPERTEWLQARLRQWARFHSRT